MKKFIQFFIKNKITSLMLFAGIALFGLISLSRLPLALMPPADKKGLTVSIRYPGQSPWRIERIITMPVEEAVSAVGGIETMVTSSKDGEAKFYITFSDDAEMKYKTVQLREKIDPVRASFPRDVDEPEIYGSSADERPAVIITLGSDTVPINGLRDIAEKRLKKLFERIEGVSEVAVGGGVKREIEIAVCEDRLIAHGIGFNQITRALQMNNFNVPAGYTGGPLERAIIIEGKYRSIDDIRQTPLFSTGQGSPVTIGDIAGVRDYAGRREDVSLVNGRENVSLYIMKAGASNCIELSKRVREVVSSVREGGYTIEIAYDQADFIKKAIGNLVIDCIIGILLASMVLYLFFGSFRQAVPLMCAIPFSLLAVFIYFHIRGISLNVISLSGLALAAGMVVDNGIVVLDSINRQGTRADAGAAAVMSRAIFGSTLTVVCIFIPVIFYSGSAMGIYRDMAGSVIVALSSSFFIAITLIPLAASLLHEGRAPSRDECTAIRRLRAYTREALKKLPGYEKTMFFLFARRRRVFLVLAALLGFTALCASMMGSGYIDAMETNELYATVELPPGTSLKETSRVVGGIESRLRGDKRVRELASKIEKSHAELILRLEDHADRMSCAADLRRLVSGDKSAFVFFEEERSPTASSEVDFEITGPDVEAIRGIAHELASKLMRLGDAGDVVLRFKEGSPGIDIVVDARKAMETGLTSGGIGDFVRDIVYGPVAAKFIDEGEVDIRSRLLMREEDILDNLRFLRIITPKGKAVPLGEVSTIKKSENITTIWRRDRMRMETVTARPGTAGPERFAAAAGEAIRGMCLPPGYHIDFGDSLKLLKKSKMEMTAGMALAIALMYMVAASLFESFLIPAAVLIAIPFALTGAVLALTCFGISLNPPVYMGLIILVGIAVNNAIVLVDTMERLRMEGAFMDAPAIIRASHDRIRPIAMTTITTVLGICPMLFGGSGSGMWRGFALTVVSGLVCSSALVIYIVPLAYELCIRHIPLRGKQHSLKK